MNNRKNKEKQLLKELKKCWYLPKEDKSFWIENMSDLPNHTLLNVLKSIQHSNKLMSKFLQTAIDENPGNNYVKEIKAKINQIKLKAFEIEEEESKSKLDDELERQINNI